MSITEFNISTFKSNLAGGARSYLFEYVPEFPATATAIEKNAAAYLVRSTSLPEETVDEIMVQWQGADFKMAGRRTFNDWTITFNVDKASKLRQNYNEWMRIIHNFNLGSDGEMKYGELSEYMMSQSLSMLDYDGAVINTIKLVDAWPKAVGPITLDYSAMDIAQFDVTFSYQFHVFELETT